VQTDLRETVAAERRSRSRARADEHRLVTGGSDLSVRPVRITDVEPLERMFSRFSRESIRFRFFSPLPRVPRAALLRLTVVDHRRDEAIVAVNGDEIVGVAGYNGLPAAVHPGPRDAELAVAVEDAWQRRGVGRALAHRLAVLARARGCDAFLVRMLPENRAALGLVRNLVPDANVRFADGEYGARVPLARGEH
jgi:GNAT superfamily N-acetyltransferase